MAIVVVIVFRIVTGIQGYLLRPDSYGVDGSPLSWMLWLMLAAVFGLFYCARASGIAMCSRPLPRSSCVALALAWLITLVPVARFAGWHWLAWLARVW
jgi:hypothetical protein